MRKKLYIFIFIFNIINSVSFSQPDLISGLKLWLKTDYGIVKDANNKVSAWNDASGNGYIFSQSNLDKQPLYITSIDSMNHKPAIKFDNSTITSNQQITIGTFFILTDFNAATFPTYCGLLTRINVVDNPNDFILIGTPNSTYFNTNYNNCLGYTIFINNAHTYNFAPLPTPKIVCGYKDNGVTWGDIAFGIDRSIEPRFWHGNIYEVIIYDRVLNSTEIENVKNYLKEKYAMDF